MPAFPEKKYFQAQDKPVEWISTDRQMAVIEMLPGEHQPIFLWLKYHLRRPAEACALHWSDYDAENQCFIIRHNLSNRVLVERTKTGASHIVPCHDEFKPVLDGLRRSNIGKFVFTHKNSRQDGKRYNVKFLEFLWNKARDKAGETIGLYNGTKHSSCSQYVNELGLSLPELQAVTGHASMDAVKKYANVELARKRELMHTTKIIPLKKAGNE
jgi:integrase